MEHNELALTEKGRYTKNGYYAVVLKKILIFFAVTIKIRERGKEKEKI